MTIYTVLFDWATEDFHDVDLFIYTDELSAREKFKSLVHDEKQTENSWCGEFFTPEGKFNKKYANLVDYAETSELFHLQPFNSSYYSTIKFITRCVE